VLRRDVQHGEARGHTFLLLPLLDEKAAGNELLARIARHLRQDWEKRGKQSIAPQRSAVRVLPWVLLPPSKGEPQLQRLLAQVRDFAKRNPTIPIDGGRIPYANSLRPKQVYVGQEHFDGYFVFLFARSSKVLLENPIEGNAAYIIFRNWQHLSTLTKAELLARKDCRRIIHSGEWKHAIKEALGL
jgi:hypothetical protein